MIFFLFVASVFWFHFMLIRTTPNRALRFWGKIDLLCPTKQNPEEFSRQFMTPTSGMQLKAQKKDGAQIDIQLTVSEGTVSSNKSKFYAAFCRDLTGVLLAYRELSKEKERSEKLLYNCFPKTGM